MSSDETLLENLLTMILEADDMEVPEDMSLQLSLQDNFTVPDVFSIETIELYSAVELFGAVEMLCVHMQLIPQKITKELLEVAESHEFLTATGRRSSATEKYSMVQSILTTQLSVERQRILELLCSICFLHCVKTDILLWMARVVFLVSNDMFRKSDTAVTIVEVMVFHDRVLPEEAKKKESYRRKIKAKGRDLKHAIRGKLSPRNESFISVEELVKIIGRAPPPPPPSINEFNIPE